MLHPIRPVQLLTLVAALAAAPLAARAADEAPPAAPAEPATTSAGAGRVDATSAEPAPEVPPAAAATADAGATDAAPAAAPPPPSEAPALAAPPPPPAGAALRARPLALAPRSQPPRVEWYAPVPADQADASLIWNRSILGGFDPWTKRKVTLLAQHHGLELALPAAEGMNEYGDEGFEEKISYPSSSFSGSFPGVRLEIGNWALAVATATGKLTWDASDETGPSFTTQATTYEAIISRGFGAWAFFDGSGADVRVGLSWPELYVRLLYGQYEPEILDGEMMDFGIAGAGISLLGLRVTVGDLFFAEVRAGDFSIHSAVSYVRLGGDEDPDVLVQTRTGFDLRPMLRVGLAL